MKQLHSLFVSAHYTFNDNIDKQKQFIKNVKHSDKYYSFYSFTSANFNTIKSLNKKQLDVLYSVEATMWLVSQET